MENEILAAAAKRGENGASRHSGRHVSSRAKPNVPKPTKWRIASPIPDLALHIQGFFFEVKHMWHTSSRIYYRGDFLLAAGSVGSSSGEVCKVQNKNF